MPQWGCMGREVSVPRMQRTDQGDNAEHYIIPLSMSSESFIDVYLYA